MRTPTRRCRQSALYVPQAEPPTVAAEANGAGCVLVRATNIGDAVVVALDQVVLVPGWTDEVKDNRSARVDVRFTQPATGDRVEVRIEPGRRIVIK